MHQVCTDLGITRGDPNPGNKNLLVVPVGSRHLYKRSNLNNMWVDAVS